MKPNLENAYGFVPFFTPIYRRNVHYLWYFLNSGRSDIDVFECNGWNPLHQLVFYSLSDGVKELLSSQQYANYVPSKDDIDACHEHWQTDAGLCERWILFKYGPEILSLVPMKIRRNFTQNTGNDLTTTKPCSNSLHTADRASCDHAMRTELTQDAHT